MAASKKPELDFHFPLSAMRALLVQSLLPLCLRFALNPSNKSIGPAARWSYRQHPFAHHDG
jgi:hypothetical protein